MGIWDILDDFVFGPLNLINRFEGLVKSAIYGDTGYRMSIPSVDKGGKHTLSWTRSVLKKYGVATYGCTHDANNMYFSVKKRQARWAEYILLHAGVELTSPTFDVRNPEYVAQHEPGYMPRPWSER